MSALVLASQSASRRAMLTEAGVPFTARAADVDERGIEVGPRELEIHAGANEEIEEIGIDVVISLHGAHDGHGL